MTVAAQRRPPPTPRSVHDAEVVAAVGPVTRLAASGCRVVDAGRPHRPLGQEAWTGRHRAADGRPQPPVLPGTAALS